MNITRITKLAIVAMARLRNSSPLLAWMIRLPTNLRHLFFVSMACLVATCAVAGPAISRPNVILFLADDMGYGDLACHGNPQVKTPQLDSFTREAVEFTRFYVSPMCSPTRASLMTGRYNFRTGVYNTLREGSKLDVTEVTAAQCLKKAGYATGLFGKWHLGLDAGRSPNEKGFDEALTFSTWHGAGLLPKYDDPDLLHNGKTEKYKGYCMDIFTDAAIRFIKDNHDKPFFVYLPANLIHSPLQVASELTSEFSGLADNTRQIYGMIRSIDNNFGRLRAVLKELGLEDNTLFIFTSDNGPCWTSADKDRYMAGLRGLKGTVYDNGMRVPCFMRWPAGFKSPASVARIAAHIDVLPTIVEACGARNPEGVKLDGTSLLPLLRDPSVNWPERTFFFQWNAHKPPQRGFHYAAVGEKWKLVQPVTDPSQPPKYELFEIASDPGETSNVVKEHPEIVERLKQAYDAWFDDACVRTYTPEPKTGIVASVPFDETSALRGEALQFKIAGIFGDHMVLQRERPVPVWGWADKGDEVTVEFAGQRQTAVTGVDGKWTVLLEPMQANEEGRELCVRSKGTKQEARIRDVLVGEVWLASGQSNMGWPVSLSEDKEKVLAESLDELLRMAVVTLAITNAPASDVKPCEWKMSGPDTAGGFSATAYFFARELRRALGNVPVGVVKAAMGASTCQAWTPRGTMENDPTLRDYLVKWDRRIADYDAGTLASSKTKNGELKQPDDPRVSVARPTVLFNGMIAPVQPMAIRGVIWYQGEGNNGDPLFEPLFTAMIGAWRQGFGQLEMPFLFVQLPKYKGFYPETRERQARCEKAVHHTGMAVTIDLGLADQIHPPDKIQVGLRLALKARALVYGEKLEHSGPEFESLEIRDETVRVKFSHAPGGLQVHGGEPKGFEIAGADANYFPARATISGDTVVLTAPDVKVPGNVRYAWAGVSEANLFNCSGLPAAPFRTER